MTEKKDISALESVVKKSLSVKTAGLAAINTAISAVNSGVAVGESLVGAINDLNKFTNDQLDKPCARVPPNFDDLTKDIQDITYCKEKTDRLKKIGDAFDFKDDVDVLGAGGALLDLLSDVLLTNKKWTDCIDPYYLKFFNLVPVHFYLALILKKLLDEAGWSCKNEEDMAKIAENCTEATLGRLCGQLDLPTVDPITLPSLPIIPILDPLVILQNVVIETVCSLACFYLDEIVNLVVDVMSWTDNEFVEGLTEDGEIPALVKINLNTVVFKELLDEARVVFPYMASATSEVFESYFNIVHTTESISQQEIIFLLLGEEACDAVKKLIIVGEAPQLASLGLDTSVHVVEFFEFLSSKVSVYDIIDESKKASCIPNPCLELDKAAEQKFFDQIEVLCDLVSGPTTMPEVPIAGILKQVGVESASQISVKSMMFPTHTSSKQYLEKILKVSGDSILAVNLSPATHISSKKYKEQKKKYQDSKKTDDDKSLWAQFRYGIERYSVEDVHDGEVLTLKQIMSLSNATLNDGGLKSFKKLKSKLGITASSFQLIDSADVGLVGLGLNWPGQSTPSESKKCPEILDSDFPLAMAAWNLAKSKGDPLVHIKKDPKYSYLTAKPKSRDHIEKMQKSSLGCE